jgi:hypothetical protein
LPRMLNHQIQRHCTILEKWILTLYRKQTRLTQHLVVPTILFQTWGTCSSAR